MPEAILDAAAGAVPEVVAAPVADAPAEAIPEVIAPPAAVPPPAPGRPAPVPDTARPRPAMDRVIKEMRERSREEDSPKPPPKPTPGERSARPGRGEPPKPEPKPGETPPKPAGEAPKPGEQAPKPGEAAPKPGEEPGTPSPEDRQLAEKKGPWAVANNYKKAFKAEQARSADLERRLAETGDVKSLQEKSQTLEARNKELEEEIRFHNYAKSREFEYQFEKPYITGWTAGVKELSELAVTLPDGTTRPGNGEDLLTLINLPKGEARLKAKEMFGEDFANDAMDVRRTVRELAQKRLDALDNAKKTASDRGQQMQELAKSNVQLFDRLAKADESKQDFLKPKEGDEEWNSKLAQAVKFVNDAYSGNSNDPRLTPEQRQEIVKKHVAIRNRAIGFTPMRLRAIRAEAQVASLQKELAKFKNGEPGPGAGKGEGAPAGGRVSRMEESKAKIRALGKPDPAGY